MDFTAAAPVRQRSRLPSLLLLPVLLLVPVLVLVLVLLLLLLKQPLGLSGAVQLGPNALSDAELRHGDCRLRVRSCCRRGSDYVGCSVGARRRHLGAVL